MTLEYESVIIGLVVGVIFGVALSVCRWRVPLVSGVAAIAVAFVLLLYGLAGLESYGRELIDEALLHRELLVGAALGSIAAVAIVGKFR